ncbi:MAG: hypothetical protein ACOX5S_01235 [Patescibacteria group bacterium]
MAGIIPVAVILTKVRIYRFLTITPIPDQVRNDANRGRHPDESQDLRSSDNRHPDESQDLRSLGINTDSGSSPE